MMGLMGFYDPGISNVRSYPKAFLFENRFQRAKVELVKGGEYFPILRIVCLHHCGGICENKISVRYCVIVKLY